MKPSMLGVLDRKWRKCSRPKILLIRGVCQMSVESRHTGAASSTEDASSKLVLCSPEYAYSSEVNK